MAALGGAGLGRLPSPGSLAGLDLMVMLSFSPQGDTGAPGPKVQTLVPFSMKCPRRVQGALWSGSVLLLLTTTPALSMLPGIGQGHASPGAPCPRVLLS